MDAKLTAEQQQTVLGLLPIVYATVARLARLNEQIRADRSDAEADGIAFLCELVLTRTDVQEMAPYCQAALDTFYSIWPRSKSVHAVLVPNHQLDIAVEAPPAPEAEPSDLSESIGTLPDKHAFVIRSLFGIGTAQRGPAVLARELGISESRIFAIRKRALRRLRERLGAYERA